MKKKLYCIQPLSYPEKLDKYYMIYYLVLTEEISQKMTFLVGFTKINRKSLKKLAIIG